MAISQGYIQSIAQDAQQTIPNNGNPNTVYNVAPQGAATTGWAGPQVMPAANYSGGVNVGQVIQAGNENVKNNGWVAPAPAPNAPPVGQGIITLPSGWAEEIKNFQPKTTEQVGGGTTEPQKPSYDLNKQWIVMDGNVPRKNSTLYANDPAYRAAWDQIFAEHQSRSGKSIENKSSGVDSMTQALRMYYQMYYDNEWRPDSNYTSTQGKTGNPQGSNNLLGADYYTKTDPKGWARLLQSGLLNRTNSGGGTNTATGGANGGTGSGGGGDVGAGLSGGRTRTDIDLGAVANRINSGEVSNVRWNTDSSKSVADNLNNFVSQAFSEGGNNKTAQGLMTVLDMVTEPFLPGNMYMSELGRANLPNILSAVMNQVVPGLGTLGKWLADKIPQDAGGVLGKIRDFFRTGKFQEAANEIYKTLDVEKAQNQAIYGGGGNPGGAGVSNANVGGGWANNFGGGGGSSSGGYTITMGGSGGGGGGGGGGSGGGGSSNSSSSSAGSNKKKDVVTQEN